MSHRNSQHVSFFAKQFIHSKNGTQKDTKTNHYILLTNVSIKRCIIPGSEPCSSGGGKSSSQTSTLQTITRVIQVMSIRCYLQHVSMCVFTVASQQAKCGSIFKIVTNQVGQSSFISDFLFKFTIHDKFKRRMEVINQ